MTSIRKSAFLRTVKPFLAGVAVSLAGQKMLGGRRRIKPPVDPLGLAAGRGAPGMQASEAAIAEGYEVADANGRDLGITIAIFAGSTACAIAAVILCLRVFGGAPVRYGAFTQEQRHHIEPPAPHLQADPVDDLARYQAQQSSALGSYGKLGPGLAHIPIARAMTLLQGKSLDAPLQVQK